MLPIIIFHLMQSHRMHFQLCDNDNYCIETTIMRLTHPISSRAMVLGLPLFDVALFNRKGIDDEEEEEEEAPSFDDGDGNGDGDEDGVAVSVAFSGDSVVGVVVVGLPVMNDTGANSRESR